VRETFFLLALSLGRAIDCGNTLDFGTRKRRHR
jgi:hypothetical protein